MLSNPGRGTGCTDILPCVFHFLHVRNLKVDHAAIKNSIRQYVPLKNRRTNESQILSGAPRISANNLMLESGSPEPPEYTGWVFPYIREESDFRECLF
jgi:hypothetical protein